MKKKKWKKIEKEINRSADLLVGLLGLFTIGIIFSLAALFIATLNIKVITGIIAYGCLFYIYGLVVFPYIYELKKINN